MVVVVVVCHTLPPPAPFNSCFPGEPGSAGFPVVSSSTCSRREPLEMSGTGLLWSGCPSCQPDQQHQSAEGNTKHWQWPGLVSLLPPLDGFLTEGRWSLYTGFATPVQWSPVTVTCFVLIVSVFVYSVNTQMRGCLVLYHCFSKHTIDGIVNWWSWNWNRCTYLQIHTVINPVCIRSCFAFHCSLFSVSKVLL